MFVSVLPDSTLGDIPRCLARVLFVNLVVFVSSITVFVLVPVLACCLMYKPLIKNVI